MWCYQQLLFTICPHCVMKLYEILKHRHVYFVVNARYFHDKAYVCVCVSPLHEKT